jgi:hypothetical protein
VVWEDGEVLTLASYPIRQAFEVVALAATVDFCKLRAMRIILVLVLAVLCLPTRAAEQRFSFTDIAAGQTPPNFRSLLAGEGKPGEWKIVMDEVPPLLAPLTPQAPSVTRRAVLGQLAQDATDEHFPMLMFEGETFNDFQLMTRLKIVSGQAEQMAGIAFRVQDEKNFYVIRASALGRNVRFYKVVNGLRSPPIGPEVDVPKGVWHELKIQCKGNEIRAEFNGREVFPPLTDSSFNAGKIAFWTKSDSVSYFTDTVISYTPRVPLAQNLVQDMLKKYPRILALKVYAPDAAKLETRVIASKNGSDLGAAGGTYESKTIATGEIFHSKSQDHVALVMPLRDRNGDIIAAVRVHLTTFAGQTEKNALARATPIVKEMQARVQTAESLLE